jgi:hypothetical protein
MPYPESCPECGSTFRNTGTHFTARRNEVGRHVLLELGCQNTTRRFWWDFTTGSLTQDGQPSAARQSSLAASLAVASASNGVAHAATNGHAAVAALDPGEPADRSEPGNPIDSGRPVDAGKPLDGGNPIGPGKPSDPGKPIAAGKPPGSLDALHAVDSPRLANHRSIETTDSAAQTPVQDSADTAGELVVESALGLEPLPAPESSLGLPIVDLPGPPLSTSPPLKDAFVRQLQLDRLTLRQMRSWLMADDARRAIEVAAGATEATYERLALILFGVDLPQLLGKQTAVPASSGMSAEERLELQRERARIRARLRRAAAKAARQPD